MLKIYLVDDEQMIIDELLEIVDWEKIGYTVCGFSNDSRTALEETNLLRPDVIICDINMGELNGLKMIGQVLQKYPETGVIFLTAYDNFGYAVEAVNLHALAYLMKPVRTEELVRVLKEYRSRRCQRVFFKFMEFALTGRADEEEIKKAEKESREYGFVRSEEKYCFIVCGDGIDVPEEAIVSRSAEGRTLILMRGDAFDESLFSGADCCAGTGFYGRENFFRYASEAVREYDGRQQAGLSETEVIAALKQMLEDMAQNYGDKISLKKYADQYHYNTSYLSEQFKAYVGMNFIDYLVKTRLEKAKILMRDPQMSMMEIAERVGYEDYSHFSKLFKKHERYSPVEYRKNFC